MNTNSMLLASLAAFALGASRASAADLAVSVFYDALEPHGEWIEASDYGYVWTPRGVDADWRPYTDGQWVYTDAGWTWTSEEPYSWAVHHYGRWVNLDEVGWSWVPDSEWGPAWVSWRHSDQYVGWAPLPPESRETVRVGVNLGNWVDTYYDVGPSSYSFVEVRNIGAPRLRAVVLPPRENITFIHQTTNITNITVRNNVVVNEGPDYNVISRQSAQPVRRLKLERQTDIADASYFQGDRHRTRIQGETLSIAAPRFAAAAAGAAAPRKLARKVQVAGVNRGWKDAGDAQKVESFRTKLQTEAKPPANLPPVQRRERAGAGAPGADRPTARGGNETDPSTRPPAPDRDGRQPRDTNRPPVGTAGAPTEDPSKPTADPARRPTDPAKPTAETRPPGADRPGQPGRKPGDEAPGTRRGAGADSTRPAAGAPDAGRPAAATPDPVAAARPGQADRPGQRRPGDRRAEPAEGSLPRDPAAPAKPQGERNAPGVGDRPDAAADRPGAAGRQGNPDRPGAAGRPDGADRPGAAGAAERRGPNADRPPTPEQPPAGADRPAGAGRPGREGRPDAADRLGNPDRPGAAADRPGARPDGPGNPRPDRPQGARGPGGDRPEGARGPGANDRPNPGQGERGKPAGAGPGATPAAKPGKADEEKARKEKEKKDGE